jgi:uncharacterized protein YyaL (SSP411 family)
VRNASAGEDEAMRAEDGPSRHVGGRCVSGRLEAGGSVVNRLATATSPYLLQHKDNPVDWREWGDEAFAEARRRDVPVLLSVGYAACHWCHVMAHESFEDEAVAAVMNERFVNVKVDREERPDVDAVYMAATQALTGQGGWPMTAFLTHDGAPFFAGTYFPPRPRGGAPSFGQLLDAVDEAWRERRGEVEAAARRIVDALAAGTSPGRGSSGSSLLRGRGGQGRDAAAQELVASAVRVLAAAEDVEHGGFGGAPKFPPSMVLEFLLRHAARRLLLAAEGSVAAGGTAGDDLGDDTGEQALGLADRTLRAMARSGMYDQVAGGFARYAVDRAWVVPHFEKMLYDNAQLALVYLHWWRLTGEPTGSRVALETCDWMLAALATPQGGLASSLDADTTVPGPDGRPHGVEGLTYVWTPAQLARLLPDDDAIWARELLRVVPGGTFEDGASTLQLDRDVWADPRETARWRRIREVLAAARAQRPQPARDDKVVAAWNGLAIAALAETGALLDRPDLVAAAERAAALLLEVHVEPGPRPAPDPAPLRLRRVSRDGRAGEPWGVLEDYGDVASGLLTLHAVTGAPRWLQAAGGLLETVLTHFGDGRGVGPGESPGEGPGDAAGVGATLFDTADFAADAALAGMRRPLDPTDGAYPSGTSGAAAALLGYAAATGSARHREAAEAALGAAAQLGGSAPRAFGWALATVEALVDGPREVAVVAGVQAPAGPLHRIALAGTAPGLVVSVGPPDAPGVPLLAHRPLRDGRATAYVCRGFVCQAPTTSAQILAAQVGARRPLAD